MDAPGCDEFKLWHTGFKAGYGDSAY
jgi:hypothetical protein